MRWIMGKSFGRSTPDRNTLNVLIAMTRRKRI